MKSSKDLKVKGGMKLTNRDIRELPEDKEIGSDKKTLNDIPADELFDGLNFGQQQDSVKELFHEKLVRARTDLSARQVSKIARAYYMAQELGMYDLVKLLDGFLTLRISKDRSSRKEFVEGLKAKADMLNAQNNNLRMNYGRP